MRLHPRSVSDGQIRRRYEHPLFTVNRDWNFFFRSGSRAIVGAGAFQKPMGFEIEEMSCAGINKDNLETINTAKEG
jgi:hypothetical protein